MLAWSSVRFVGDVGAPPAVPHANAVNDFAALFSYTLEGIMLSELGRRGVFEYAYSGTVSCSTALQLGLESMSNTVIEISDDAGRTTGWSCWVQP